MARLPFAFFKNNTITKQYFRSMYVLNYEALYEYVAPQSDVPIGAIVKSAGAVGTEISLYSGDITASFDYYNGGYTSICYGSHNTNTIFNLPIVEQHTFTTNEHYRMIYDASSVSGFSDGPYAFIVTLEKQNTPKTSKWNGSPVVITNGYGGATENPYGTYDLTGTGLTDADITIEAWYDSSGEVFDGYASFGDGTWYFSGNAGTRNITRLKHNNEVLSTVASYIY